MNKWLFAGGLLFAFIIGFILAPSQTTKTEVKEVKEVCSQETAWRQLKEVDDKGFQSAVNIFGIADKLLRAETVEEFDSANDAYKVEVATVKDLAVKRQMLLKQLGY